MWFSISAEEAAAVASTADLREEVAFPDRISRSVVYYRRSNQERLAALVVTDVKDGVEDIVAYLPVPTRVGLSPERPTDVLGRLCLRFGEWSRFARESVSLLVRISATASPTEVGSFPTMPFEHKGDIFAPVYLAEVVSPTHWECRLCFILQVSALQRALADPDPWKAGHFDNLDLVNGLLTLFSDNVNCITNWGFYLLDPQFANEPELRNKVGTIWLISLLDSIEGETRAAALYRSAANEQGLAHLVSVADQLDRFFACIREVLCLFSREEQIFLRDFRDQLVHSWLARRHAPSTAVKIFLNGELKVERIDRSAFGTLVRPFYEAASLDQTIGALLVRALNQERPYWRAVHELRVAMPLLQDAMLLGRNYEIRALSE